MLLADLFVSTFGSDANPPYNPSAPLRSIQQAVTLARSGDVILVAGGTYTYDPAASATYTRDFGSSTVVTVINKQLAIVGGYSPGDWRTYNPAANPTIIDAQGAHRGIWVEGFPQPNATSLILKGVTITNGRAWGNPNVTEAQRVANPAIVDGVGGGMLVNYAPVHIEDVLFTNNLAIGASNNYLTIGGAAAGGGLALQASAARPTAGTMVNVAFGGNASFAGSGGTRGGYGQGGGLFTAGYILNAAHLRFVGNGAQGGSTPGIGVDAIGELGDAQGGAIDIHIGSTARINGLFVENNLAIGGEAPGGNASAAYGGGVYSERADLAIANAVIRFNGAQGGNSGRDAVEQPAGFANGGGIMTINTFTSIYETQVFGNRARGGNGPVYKGSAGGGGIALVSQPQNGYAVGAIVSNTLVANNTVTLGGGSSDARGGGGGGIWLDGPVTTIVHSTIAGNTIEGTNPSRPTLQGQGIIVGPSVQTGLYLQYSIIANHLNNLNAGNGFAAALSVQPTLPGQRGPSAVEMHRNLFANNSNHTNQGQVPSPSGNYVERAPYLNIYAASAGFVNAEVFDYRISGNSLAVNAALNSPYTIDLLNRRRSGVADLGALEA